jgi:hypothetical protein
MTDNRHSLAPTVLFTDGVKYVADTAGAYWLLDEIALARCYENAVAAEVFQRWKLKVANNITATLTCDDGNVRVICGKAIRFADFPGSGARLYLSDKAIMHESEY